MVCFLPLIAPPQLWFTKDNHKNWNSSFLLELLKVVLLILFEPCIPEGAGKMTKSCEKHAKIFMVLSLFIVKSKGVKTDRSNDPARTFCMISSSCSRMLFARCMPRTWKKLLSHHCREKFASLHMSYAQSNVIWSPKLDQNFRCRFDASLKATHENPGDQDRNKNLIDPKMSKCTHGTRRVFKINGPRI